MLTGKIIRSILLGITLIGAGMLAARAADPANQYYPNFVGECTWYAAERRADLRFNYQHAYTWADKSKANGFIVDTTPEVGAIAVWAQGKAGASDCCGHVAYVMSVTDPNNFRVEEYNVDVDHGYGQRDITLEEGIQFIHGKPPPLPDPIVAYTYSFNPNAPTVGARVQITVGASDNAGHRAVNALEVLVDGAALGTLTSASGTLAWNTSGAAAGTHRISFRARLAGWSGNVNAREVNLVLQAPTTTTTPPRDGGPDPWDTSWVPSDRNRVIGAIETIITSAETGGSPNAGLKGFGGSVLNYAFAEIEPGRASVNPAFALAMFRKEANFATYGAAPGNKNPGNIICAGTRPLYGATRCNGRFGVYPSMDTGIKAYYWLLQYEYKPGSSRNCADITCIITAYAPSSENNTRLYIDQVSAWTRDFQNRISNGAPPPLPPPLPPPAAAPNPPTLRAPSNRSGWFTTDEIVLSWNATANATQYKVELSGGPYSTMTPCDWQSGMSCRIGAMREGQMQWRVQARNANGESDWSDTWTFTIQSALDPITRTPTPTATSTRAPAPSAQDLQVSSGLSLSNTAPQIGETVTAIFRFKNVSSRVLNITRLIAGARGPGARSLEWSAREVDFPARTNLTLQPGAEMEYRESRSFDQAGDYFAEPAWLEAGTSKWEGIVPYPRVWFNVQSRASLPTLTPTPSRTPVVITSPGRLVIVQGLNISNSNPQVNQSVNAQFRVRNDGGQAITARYLGVKARHSSGTTYDFFWHENITLQPGQEFTYDANRSFDRVGSFQLTPNWNDGANWRDLAFANGSTNYVTINVASAPPTLTAAPPQPTGNLASRARREPDGIASGNAFDGNLSTFWTNGLGHQFNLRLTLQDAATINRIIVWDRPQNSPDNQQINALILSLSNGWSKRFNMNSGGPRCIDVTLSSGQRLSWVNLKADDASGNNGLSEVEIWAGNKTTGINCSNKGNLP